MAPFVRVAVDAMTAERGIAEVVHGAARALRDFPDLQVILVGAGEALRPLVEPLGFGERLQVVHASEVIGMDEDPGSAFKSKKDASVSVAARLVKEGKADAATSPGNTGASMAAATFILGRIAGVRRPAILTLMPSAHGTTGVLDTGAMVDAKPEDLVQWGMMGSIYLQAVIGVEKPRVGLLSIGEEEGKGNAQTWAATPLMKAAPFHYIGNVEGRDIFNGRCDVAVCDGFTGNIVLKTAEGISKMIISGLKEAYLQGGLLGKIGALLSKPSFNRFRKRVSPDELGGMPLLGVGGNFIITHGSANRVMIKNAIRVGYESSKADMVRKLSAAIEAGPGKEA